jgi:hypothetical protein
MREAKNQAPENREVSLMQRKSEALTRKDVKNEG